MLFLLLKIFFLLVLAALCGAALAWWWLRRDVDDVTEEYTRLTGDWHQWRQSFEAKLAARPEGESSALEERLAAIEHAVANIQLPRPDLSPVLSALAGMRPPPAQQVDLEPVEARLHAIEDVLTAIRIPEMPTHPDMFAAEPVDLSGITAQLDALANDVRELAATPAPTPDLSGVHAALSDIDARVEALSARVQTDPPPAVDLMPLSDRLAAIERAVEAIDLPAPAPPLDPAPILARLDEIRAALAKPTPAPPAAVRSGSRNLLHSAAYGHPDDLKRIRGVAGVLEKTLHDVGIYYFWQIADWNAQDIAHVDEQLAFKGRIQRDDWVAQAQAFCREDGAAQKPPEV